MRLLCAQACKACLAAAERGAGIKKRGIYRDAVRSSGSHFVKSSGLRWISLMLLLPVSWANRTWAFPFLSVLAPSERYAKEAGKQHKKITDWARLMLFQLKRWLPAREIIAVGDSSYAVLEFLACVGKQLSFITGLRLDAALYEPAPVRIPGAFKHSEIRRNQRNKSVATGRSYSPV